MNSDASPHQSTDVNSVQEKYRSLLNEKGVQFNPEKDYKPHIKTVSLQRIPEIEFLKRGSKPEMLFTRMTRDRMLNERFQAG